MQKLKLALPLLICAALFATHTSADEFKNQIKARQAYMQVLGYNVGILGAMARGRVPYDAEMATAAAQNLNFAAQMNNGSMWPMGSDMDSHADTVAKVELWQNFSEAGGYLTDMSTATANLVGEAGNGVDAMKAAFGDVGKTCSGCHKQFRAKK